MMKNTYLENDQEDAYCGTSYAARVLGLSVGTVQSLVESGTLHAWKTSGGHRRISLRSISAFQRVNGVIMTDDPYVQKMPQVLIVEDDVNTQKMYEAYFAKWNLPLDIVIYTSAIKALMDLHFLKPVLLLTDLQMPNMNGFEFISKIREDQSFSSLRIVAITGLSDEKIQEFGGLDRDIFILKKPIDLTWLKGFLQGVLSVNA
jgi:excisionase family DNA binding protein